VVEIVVAVAEVVAVAIPLAIQIIQNNDMKIALKHKLGAIFFYFPNRISSNFCFISSES